MAVSIDTIQIADLRKVCMIFAFTKAKIRYNIIKAHPKTA